MTDASGADDADRLPRGRHARRRARIASDNGTAGLVAYFKERVYASFTGLAIVLVVGSGEHAEPQHAFLALLFGVLGISAAGFVSDMIAQLAVNGRLSGADVRGPWRVSASAFATVLLPAALVGLGWVGVLALGVALDVAAWVYIATLVTILLLAVRRARLAWWQTVLALVMLIGLAVIVLLLQTLAKSV